MGILDFVGEELARLEREELRRHLREVQSPQGPEIVLDGRPTLNFSSNDYLALADHPLVIARAKEALLTYGLGAGASRLIVGNFKPHVELEEMLCDFVGSSATLLFPSGYHANTGTIPALMGKGDVILSDELNHASIIDGCRLSRADVEVFAHNDMEALSRALQRTQNARRRMIVVEGLYSMDGDLAPLEAIWELARAHDTFLFVDEAHALGILGERGAGASDAAALPTGKEFGEDPRLLRMGTLGKALGSVGAFVAGSDEVIDFLRNSARSFVFTTALPALAAAGAMAAIRMIEKEPERIERVRETAATLRRRLAAQGWDLMESSAHILPIRIGPTERTMDISQALLKEGVYVQGIRPPTVPEGTCRLRLTVSAGHTEAHIDRLLVVMARVGSRFGVLGSSS